MNVGFHPEAAKELSEAAAYYELELPGLGARLVTEVERVMELVLEILRSVPRSMKIFGTSSCVASRSP